MIQIFVAHAEEEEYKEDILYLYDWLQEKGYDPWIKEEDLLPGQNHQSAIDLIGNKGGQNGLKVLFCSRLSRVLGRF